MMATAKSLSAALIRGVAGLRPGPERPVGGGFEAAPQVRVHARRRVFHLRAEDLRVGRDLGVVAGADLADPRVEEPAVGLGEREHAGALVVRREVAERRHDEADREGECHGPSLARPQDVDEGHGQHEHRHRAHGDAVAEQRARERREPDRPPRSPAPVLRQQRHDGQRRDDEHHHERLAEHHLSDDDDVGVEQDEGGGSDRQPGRHAEPTEQRVDERPREHSEDLLDERKRPHGRAGERLENGEHQRVSARAREVHVDEGPYRVEPHLEVGERVGEEQRRKERDVRDRMDDDRQRERDRHRAML